MDVALWAIEQALTLVHGHQLTALLRLIDSDPILALLERDRELGEEFSDLLRQFRPPPRENGNGEPPMATHVPLETA